MKSHPDIFFLEAALMKSKPVPVAGVDVSKEFSDMCILTPDNAVFERVKIYHDKASMTQSVKALARAGAAFGQRPVVVMESTSHYHRTLQQFLTRHKYQVITINPLQSSAFKNVTVRKIKSDPTDAYRLALAYRTQALRPNLVPSDKIENLRLLTRQHFDLKRDITSYVQRLQCVLDQVFPGFRKQFERLHCETSLIILEQYPTPEALKRARTSSIAKIFQCVARRSPEYCRKRAEALKAEALKALEIRVSRESADLLIKAYVSVLRALEQTIRQVDDEIHRVIHSDPKLLADVELLCSIPGVAEFGAAVIIAEIGDFSNFRKAKQLVAFFGLEPSVHQSGKYVGKNNQLSKRGSRFMRKMLHLIVQTNIAHLPGKPDVYRNPVISDYYKKKCESKAKLAACCAVMHKLVNIIFAVLRDRKPYEIRTPEEHIKLMQARCVAAVTAA